MTQEKTILDHDARLQMFNGMTFDNNKTVLVNYFTFLRQVIAQQNNIEPDTVSNDAIKEEASMWGLISFDYLCKKGEAFDQRAINNYLKPFGKKMPGVERETILFSSLNKKYGFPLLKTSKIDVLLRKKHTSADHEYKVASRISNILSISMEELNAFDRFCLPPSQNPIKNFTPFIDIVTSLDKRISDARTLWHIIAHDWRCTRKELSNITNINATTMYNTGAYEYTAFQNDFSRFLTSPLLIKNNLVPTKYNDFRTLVDSLQKKMDMQINVNYILPMADKSIASCYKGGVINCNLREMGYFITGNTSITNSSPILVQGYTHTTYEDFYARLAEKNKRSERPAANILQQYVQSLTSVQQVWSSLSDLTENKKHQNHFGMRPHHAILRIAELAQIDDTVLAELFDWEEGDVAAFRTGDKKVQNIPDDTQLQSFLKAATLVTAPFAVNTLKTAFETHNKAIDMRLHTQKENLR